MKKYVLSFLLLLLIPLTGWSAQKRAFSIEDLYRIKSVADVQISPDSKSVLYVVTTSDFPRAKRVSQVWIMDIDGRNTRQLTQSNEGATSPHFSPDGKWISFLRGSNIYLMPAGGGEAKKLTSLSTGVSDPLWSPDSKWIAFSTDAYPECSDNDACNKETADRWADGPLKAHMADELLYRHWTAWKDGTRTHIFLTDIATGAVRDLTPGNFDSPPFQLGGPVQYDFSPDGSEFVFVSNRDKDLASSTNNDLWLLSLKEKGATPRNITASNPAYDGSPQYSPDGKSIAYRMQKQPGYESDLFRLAIYDRATGATSVLTESFKNWINDYEWSDDSKSVYFTAEDQGQNPIYKLDLASKAINQIIADKTIDMFAFDSGEKKMVYAKRSVGEPVEIYSATLVGGKASNITKLTRMNQAVVDEVDIRPAETMWVTGAGGAKVQVFIVKPHNFDPTKKYPLILNVHGGPQQMWADSFRGDWQVYPGSGYVVAYANPHGSTGYGQDFTAQISGDWGGHVYEDLMKVTDALEKLPYRANAS